MMVWWLAYIGLGAFAGFFAGLLGIGGGSVMVPILVMLFAAQGFPSGDVMHLALGTSMAAIFLPPYPACVRTMRMVPCYGLSLPELRPVS
jgi:uncharacterized membrane protein YfcA